MYTPYEYDVLNMIVTVCVSLSYCTRNPLATCLISCDSMLIPGGSGGSRIVRCHWSHALKKNELLMPVMTS